jgi:hypothetical protein
MTRVPDRGRSDSGPGGISLAQASLLRRGGWIVVAMALIWVAHLILWIAVGLGPITWIIAFGELVLVIVLITTGRELRQTGPPFEDVHWWAPWSYRVHDPR